MVIGALWVNVFSAAGSLAAVGVALGGLSAVVLYGRRAAITIEAEARKVGDQVLIVARPTVRAVGVIRLHLGEGRGESVIRVTEVFQTTEGLRDGQRWDNDGVFGKAFVDGGETLRTTTLIDVGLSTPGIIGWRVSFGISVSPRFPTSGTWSWADQVFVPRS